GLGEGPRIGDFAGAVRRYGAALLTGALEDSRYNQRRAAAQLGLSYDQFRRSLKTHGLAGPVGPVATNRPSS
ncbi:MAG: helix-turn-helix domain-containing protein, partial [Acetobacteraceae bacterium]